jgi:hypothetical protein
MTFGGRGGTVYILGIQYLSVEIRTHPQEHRIEYQLHFSAGVSTSHASTSTLTSRCNTTYTVKGGRENKEEAIRGKRPQQLPHKGDQICDARARYSV